MKNNRIKLKTLNRVFGPKILSIYLIIVSVLLLSSATYAFWTQPLATQDNIVLEADSVTYLTSYLSPENGDALLTPPIAAKDSLQNNDIVIETPASVAERTVSFWLMGKTACNLLLIYQAEYLDTQDNYSLLPEGILDVELWYTPDIGLPAQIYLLSYDAQKSGYPIENFPYNQVATLTVRIRFAVVDELLDPIYKGINFKINLAFAAEKIGETG